MVRGPSTVRTWFFGRFLHRFRDFCEGFGCLRRSFGPRGPSARKSPKTPRGGGGAPSAPLRTSLTYYDRIAGGPGLSGVSAGRHWPGEWGGVCITPPTPTPQTNSQSNDCSETGKAVFERFWRDSSKGHFIYFLKVTCQVKVRSKVKIEHLRILVLRNASSTQLLNAQTRPNYSQRLDEGTVWVKTSYYVVCTGEGHGQVTKGHYNQISHSGHVKPVLWAILAIRFDGVRVWSSGAIWSGQVRPGSSVGRALNSR